MFGGQILPHVPQLFGSAVRLKQEIPHASYGESHSHLPSTQRWPKAQELPHELPPSSGSGGSVAQAMASTTGAIIAKTNIMKREGLKAVMKETPLDH